MGKQFVIKPFVIEPIETQNTTEIIKTIAFAIINIKRT